MDKFMYQFDKVNKEFDMIEKRSYLKKRYVVQHKALKEAQARRHEKHEIFVKYYRQREERRAKEAADAKKENPAPAAKPASSAKPKN